jgi:hypothetical protein
MTFCNLINTDVAFTFFVVFDTITSKICKFEKDKYTYLAFASLIMMVIIMMMIIMMMIIIIIIIINSNQ